MRNTDIRIEPLTGNIGAEIHGVDLCNGLPDSEFEIVQKAFLEHQVVFFREQELSPDQHVAVVVLDRVQFPSSARRHRGDRSIPTHH